MEIKMRCDICGYSGHWFKINEFMDQSFDSWYTTFLSKSSKITKCEKCHGLAQGRVNMSDSAKIASALNEIARAINSHGARTSAEPKTNELNFEEKSNKMPMIW